MIYIILSAVFFCLTILFLVLYTKADMKLRKIIGKENKEFENLNLEIKNLNRKLAIAIEDLSPKKKWGYYKETVTLVSEEDKKNNIPGDKYVCIVYVKEMERFTNGESKTQIMEIEIESGFASDQYEYVKGIVRKRFVSIKNTVDIEWLESQNEVKEMRKQKLEKIKNIDKTI